MTPDIPTWLASVKILHGHDLPAYPSEEIDESVQVVPFVNEGRWCVLCPNNQTHAILACEETPLFFCPYDFNIWNGGRPVRIVWPEEAEEVERLLLERSDPVNMNYFPGEETPVILLAENKFMSEPDWVREQ